ncbi:MAG TPA: DUF3160 domain-containing protein [Polyangiales bacterium]|nr:DUF3160 domain-containing protein [Polyangiales bacterium]
MSNARGIGLRLWLGLWLALGLVVSGCDVGRKTGTESKDAADAMPAPEADAAVPVDSAAGDDNAAQSGSGAAGSGGQTEVDEQAGAGGQGGAGEQAGAGGQAGGGGQGGYGGEQAGAGGQGGSAGNAGADGEAGSGGAAGEAAPPHEVAPVGTTVTLSLGNNAASELSGLADELDELKDLTTAQLLAKRKHAQAQTLSYDPSGAVGLDLIQASSLKLDDSELATLEQRGFVVSRRQRFPHMLYGYDTIYTADLPLYVSADSILDAVHHSYDRMLEDVESELLVSQLSGLLGAMHGALATAPGSSLARTNADLYLTVARQLLSSYPPIGPVAGADAAQIASIVEAAKAAAGPATIELFGGPRAVDFSQFAPRGHYAISFPLSNYYRALMWLGRIDLRLIETNPDGTQTFHRDQLETAVLLSQLLDATGLANFQRIDTTLQTFFGPRDSMSIPEVATLLADLGIHDGAGLAALSDQQLAQAIITGGYGQQRIASQLITKANPSSATLPLGRSFLLFGQRYVVDAHVLSQVSHDRVDGRLTPDPLDAAYAALGNDQAAQLLEPQLAQYSYAPALEAMRVLVDKHDEAYWTNNLYSLWLGSLRTLSPSALPADLKAAGLPAVAATEAWGRRLLNTQLASWAQLRHDTNLYVATQYAPGGACEFPDAYVDPYPEFYAAIIRLAEHGAVWTDSIALFAPDFAQRTYLYFDHLRSTMIMLRDMAVAQRNGTSFSAEQMAFINRAVHKAKATYCSWPSLYTGWYAGLEYESSLQDYRTKDEFWPTITDVHTQPTDLGETNLGRVLHVGTGYVRLMVVTTDTCGTPKAYAGLAFSYYEQVTDNWKRLSDSEWHDKLNANPKPADVAWTEEFLGGAL